MKDSPIKQIRILAATVAGKINSLKTYVDNLFSSMSNNKTLVKSTFDDLETYLKDVNNKGKLPVGTNIFIEDSGVPDYWVSEVLESADSETGYYYKINEIESKTDLSDYAKKSEIPEWSMSETKPQYTADEVGAATIENVYIIDKKREVEYILGHVENYKQPKDDILNLLQTKQSIGYDSHRDQFLICSHNNPKNDDQFYYSLSIVDSSFENSIKHIQIEATNANDWHLGSACYSEELDRYFVGNNAGCLMIDPSGEEIQTTLITNINHNTLMWDYDKHRLLSHGGSGTLHSYDYTINTDNNTITFTEDVQSVVNLEFDIATSDMQKDENDIIDLQSSLYYKGYIFTVYSCHHNLVSVIDENIGSTNYYGGYIAVFDRNTGKYLSKIFIPAESYYDEYEAITSRMDIMYMLSNGGIYGSKIRKIHPSKSSGLTLESMYGNGIAFEIDCDVNSVIIPGRYYGSGAVVSTLKNTPMVSNKSVPIASNPSTMIVERIGQKILKQSWYDYTHTWERTSLDIGVTWSTWELTSIAHPTQLLTAAGIEDDPTRTVDLNDIKQYGVYISGESRIVNKNKGYYKNCPTDETFRLLVDVDNNGNVIQTLYPFNQAGTVIRYYYAYQKTWTNWTGTDVFTGRQVKIDANTITLLGRTFTTADSSNIPEQKLGILDFKAAGTSRYYSDQYWSSIYNDKVYHRRLNANTPVSDWEQCNFTESTLKDHLTSVLSITKNNDTIEFKYGNDVVSRSEIPVIDDTLTIEGAAADAKKVKEEILKYGFSTTGSDQYQTPIATGDGNWEWQEPTVDSDELSLALADIFGDPSNSNGSNITLSDLNKRVSILENTSYDFKYILDTRCEDKSIQFANLLYGDNIANVSASQDIETFIFFTDPHTTLEYPLTVGQTQSDRWRSVTCNFISEVEKYYNNTPVNYVMSGGDWLQSWDPAPVACYKLGFIGSMMKKAFQNNYCNIVGNHDTNYLGRLYQGASANSTILSEASIRNIMYDGKPTYFTYDGMNTLWYCFNSGTIHFDMSTDNNLFKNQIIWFAESLLNNNHQHIALFSHMIDVDNGTTRLLDGDYIPHPLMDEIFKASEAFNNKTIYTFDSVNYDYTNAIGKVEFSLSGHLHADGNVTIHNIPCILTKNARYSSVTFDMVFVDYTNRYIKMIRVGDGVDRTISLDTGEII